LVICDSPNNLPPLKIVHKDSDTLERIATCIADKGFDRGSVLSLVTLNSFS